MQEHNNTVLQPDFRDRKTRLVVFGALQIVLGGLCAMMAPMMIIGMIASAVSGSETVAGTNFKSMIPAALFYAMAAVWFIWMGVGSLKARRWARALILIFSWYWLIIGIFGFLFILLLLPNMFDKMATSDEVPKTVTIIIQCVMMGFMAVFYIIIPGLLVLFYRGRDVKATCEYYDSQTRWTDKCPLPVLGAALACAMWAVSMPAMGFNNWVIPFFGTPLSGITGAGAVIALCLLLSWIAWGLYRLNSKAWWAALLAIGGWSVSVIITFSTISTETYYEKAGMTAEQIEVIKRFDFQSMRWPMLLWIIFALAYLFWIRKFFVNRPDHQPVELTNHPI